jgi:enoyl-CoA hydratase
MLTETIMDHPPLLQIDGAVATLTLRRPERANRIEFEDLEVLRTHCADLASRRDVRAVVLTATGKTFSAGYDLDSILNTVDRDPSAAVIRNPFAEMVDAFEALPQVTIGAFNGGVYGGATDLALACDFRLGVHGMKMFMPAAQLGLLYYASGLKRYVARLGLDTTKRIFLLAEHLDAEELKRVGFLHELHSAQQLPERARVLSLKASSMAPLASTGMKKVLNAIAHNDLDLQAAASAETQALRSLDIQEGVRAWHERREPKFKGI